MRINIPNHDRKRLQHRLCHGLFVSTLCFFSKSSRICFKVSCFSTKLSCNSPGQVKQWMLLTDVPCLHISTAHCSSLLLAISWSTYQVRKNHLRNTHHEQSECANSLLPWFWPCSMEHCAVPIRLAVPPAQSAHTKKGPHTVRQKTYDNARANPENSQSHS